MTDPGLEQFWDACGAAAPLRLLVWERGQSDPREHQFPRPFAILGRCDPADLTLDDPHISRRHAAVLVIGGRAFCVDLGSRSALSWGGAPRRAGWIESGRLVEVGPYRIAATSPNRPPEAGEPTDPLGIPAPGTSRADRLVLETVANAASGPVRWPVDRTLTLIGRGPECRLRLSDPGISRIHCALLRLDDSLWLVDLFGREGTAVNDAPRRWAPLAIGDRLALGRHQFFVRRESSTALGLPGPAPRRAGVPAIPSWDVEVLPGIRPARVEPATPPVEVHVHSPIDPALAPLLDQFAQLQQPLLDQFALMQQQMFEQYHRSMMEMMRVFTRLNDDRQEAVDRELRRIKRLTREVRQLQRELDRQRQQEAGEGRPATLGARPAMVDDVEPIATAKAPQGKPEEYRAAHASLIARMTALQEERQTRWQRLLNKIAARGGDGGR